MLIMKQAAKVTRIPVTMRAPHKYAGSNIAPIPYGYITAEEYAYKNKLDLVKLYCYAAAGRVELKKHVIKPPKTEKSRVPTIILIIDAQTPPAEYLKPDKGRVPCGRPEARFPKQGRAALNQRRFTVKRLAEELTIGEEDLRTWISSRLGLVMTSFLANPDAEIGKERFNLLLEIGRAQFGATAAIP